MGDGGGGLERCCAGCRGERVGEGSSGERGGDRRWLGGGGLAQEEGDVGDDLSQRRERADNWVCQGFKGTCESEGRVR